MLCVVRLRFWVSRQVNMERMTLFCGLALVNGFESQAAHNPNLLNKEDGRMKIRYYVKFNPDINESSAYSLWDSESNEMIACELDKEGAEKVYRDFNRQKNVENPEFIKN